MAEIILLRREDTISTLVSSHIPLSRPFAHYPPGLFCPFAHRANLVRHIKGLTDYINISIVKPYPKGDDKGWPGWKFPKTDDEYPDSTVDHLFGSEYMHEIYFKADKEYQGRYSVPLLWDKTSGTIVNNVRCFKLSYKWLHTDSTPRKAQNSFAGCQRLSSVYEIMMKQISTYTLPSITLPSTVSPSGCRTTSIQGCTRQDSHQTKKYMTRM